MPAAQYLIMSSLQGYSTPSFESRYRVITSRDLLQRALVQVAQQRMPSYDSFIAFSAAHVQTMMEQHKKTLAEEVRKRAGKKQVERKA